MAAEQLNWGRAMKWQDPDTVESGQPRNIRRLIQIDAGAALAALRFSRVLTIALVKQIVNPGVNVDFKASIQFSAGSVTQELVCDFVDGGLIRVPGHGVIVDALPYAPRRATFDMTDLDVTLGAIVGVGGGGNIPPTYTALLDTVPALGTGDPAQPPAFARALSVYPSMNTAVDAYANMALEFVSQGPDMGLVCRVNGAALAGGAAVPLPANCNARIVNLSANHLLTPTLVWHLAVG